MEDIILVGYGGHAKSVADCIERQNKYKIVGYTDIKESESKYQYLGTDECLRKYRSAGIKNAVICVGYLGKGNLREKLYEYLKDLGYELPVIIDPTAIISESAQVEEGTVIGKGAIINADATVGKMCIINTKALVEHECVIEDFSHIAVGAVLCGQVHVERTSFVGANATVIQCMRIPNNSMIPAGTVVRNGYFEKGKYDG